MVFANNLLAGAAAGLGGAGYTPAGAIWLDGSADYLTKTFSSSGDRDDYTRSVWVKRSRLGSSMKIFDTGPDGGNNLESLYFDANNNLFWTINDSNATQYNYETSALFRDPTAWTHIVCSRTGTTLTIYINGTAVSDFDTSNNNGTTNNGRWTYTDQNVIGRYFLSGSEYFGGYFAEIIQIDGTALGADSFGKTDTNGNWVPIDPSGLTFGTNGFWLDFADSADLGKDVSGNANDWTLNSMSAANSTSDRPADNAADGLGNYATWNPLDVYAYSGSGTNTFANGNKKYTNTSAGTSDGFRATVPAMADKIYWEINIDAASGAYPIVGLLRDNGQATTSGSYEAVIQAGGGYYDFGSGPTSYTSFTTSDVVQFALDRTLPALWIGKNGTWMNGASQSEIEAGTTTNAVSTNAYLGTNLLNVLAINYNSSSTTLVADHNDATHTVPSGFVSLNTANLPAPTVTDPSKYFNTVLYTGNGTAIGSGGKAVTGVGFQPDLVWIKNRDAADSHMIFDAISGATKYINTDDTTPDTGNNPAQATDTESLTTFGSDGFTVGSNVEVNTNTENYVAWCMKFGGSGSANTDGSISSTVSAAAHGGAALIQHTGTGTNGTVGHGMSVAPALMIHKNLDTTNNQLITYCDELSTPATDYLYLNRSLAKASGGASFWNSTVPTTSVFSVGSNPSTNNSSDTILTLAFARVPGLIGIGSYTGNGSTDGPYVVVDDGSSGFRPAFLLTKDSSTTSDWTLWDSERNPYNQCDNVLFVEEPSAENTSGNAVDFTANGFKIRTSGADVNESGSTFIYLAFAEYPFGGEGVAQAKAR